MGPDEMTDEERRELRARYMATRFRDRNFALLQELWERSARRFMLED